MKTNHPTHYTPKGKCPSGPKAKSLRAMPPMCHYYNHSVDFESQKSEVLRFIAALHARDPDCPKALKAADRYFSVAREYGLLRFYRPENYWYGCDYSPSVHHQKARDLANRTRLYPRLDDKPISKNKAKRLRQRSKQK